jgi:rSAM/selenodomain-associated transferase 1
MIIVFAKAPLPGKAKTRLIPRLGEWGAARLHRRLISHTLCTARLADDRVELHGTRRHRFFQSLRVPFRLQHGDDLGERMHYALSKAKKPAILIGSDCPMLTAADLRRAARWLRGGAEVVLAPAEDGGYALIGARRVSPALFEGIAWGGKDVYEQTVKKLAGYRWRALRRVWDVDRPQDLERLRSLRLASTARQVARRSGGSPARSDGSDRP